MILLMTYGPPLIIVYAKFTAPFGEPEVVFRRIDQINSSIRISVLEFYECLNLMEKYPLAGGISTPTFRSSGESSHRSGNGLESSWPPLRGLGLRTSAKEILRMASVSMAPLTYRSRLLAGWRKFLRALAEFLARSHDRDHHLAIRGASTQATLPVGYPPEPCTRPSSGLALEASCHIKSNAPFDVDRLAAGKASSTGESELVLWSVGGSPDRPVDRSSSLSSPNVVRRQSAFLSR